MVSERKKVINRFAAFLTHLFNGTDFPGTEIVLNYGTIYYAVLRALQRNESYRALLVGSRHHEQHRGREESVNIFFDQVIDKPIALGNDPSSSNTAKLLSVLLERSALTLCRQLSISAGLRNGAVPLVDRSTGEMAAAVTTLARTDPGQMLLVAGAAVLAPLPAHLSLWRTLTLPPSRILRIPPGPALKELHNRIHEVFSSANRHFYEFLSIGVDPLVWASEIGVNQAGEIGRLVRRAQTLADVTRFADIPIASWQAAWAEKPVPGFATLDVFMDSPICHEIRGLAVRSAAIPRVALEDWVEPEASSEDPFADSDFRRIVSEAEAAGAISAYERTIFLALLDGGSLQDFAGEPAFVEAFGKQGAKIERSLLSLRDRVAGFVERWEAAEA